MAIGASALSVFPLRPLSSTYAVFGRSSPAHNVKPSTGWAGGGGGGTYERRDVPMVRASSGKFLAAHRNKTNSFSRGWKKFFEYVDPRWAEDLLRVTTGVPIGSSSRQACAITSSRWPYGCSFSAKDHLLL